MLPRTYAVILIFFLGGCSSPPEYPPTFTFPPRTDRLVLRTPTVEPSGPGSGSVDDQVNALESLGGRTLDPTTIPAESRDRLTGFLRDAFGTPGEPLRPPCLEAKSTLNLLATGGQLFRKHCVQCHGISGDGRGPAGIAADPPARDFRRGMFKFVSSGNGGKPSQDDLFRTLRDGLPGTKMPPFGLLPEAERVWLAMYVMYLSDRGQVEYQTLEALGADDAEESGVSSDLDAYARARWTKISQSWTRSLDLPPLTEPSAESVKRGYDLFAGSRGVGCVNCHRDFGRDGVYRYTVWGTVIRAANLTRAERKGGTRAEDYYARIRFGIAPSTMPAHPGLSEGEVWDLAHFVAAIPYPVKLPPEIRSIVYPPGR